MIDTHSHLLMLDSEQVIGDMSKDNLSKIVTISTNIDDAKANIALANANENVYVAVGIYPEYANGDMAQELTEIEKLIDSPKVVAVGEIGLDYHSEGYDKQAQQALLISQLKLAKKFGKPICIHCRGAAEDLYNILSGHRDLISNGALMHCYSEGADYIDKFLGLGMYISFSGNITYKKSDTSFLNRIPLNRLLVETDSPYLSPVPLRGEKNQPKNVALVIKFIAGILNMSAAELDRITTKNALKFYKIKN